MYFQCEAAPQTTLDSGNTCEGQDWGQKRGNLQIFCSPTTLQEPPLVEANSYISQNEPRSPCHPRKGHFISSLESSQHSQQQSTFPHGSASSQVFLPNQSTASLYPPLYVHPSKSPEPSDISLDRAAHCDEWEEKPASPYALHPPELAAISDVHIDNSSNGMACVKNGHILLWNSPPQSSGSAPQGSIRAVQPGTPFYPRLYMVNADGTSEWEGIASTSPLEYNRRFAGAGTPPCHGQRVHADRWTSRKAAAQDDASWKEGGIFSKRYICKHVLQQHRAVYPSNNESIAIISAHEEKKGNIMLRPLTLESTCCESQSRQQPYSQDSGYLHDNSWGAIQYFEKEAASDSTARMEGQVRRYVHIDSYGGSQAALEGDGWTLGKEGESDHRHVEIWRDSKISLHGPDWSNVGVFLKNLSRNANTHKDAGCQSVTILECSATDPCKSLLYSLGQYNAARSEHDEQQPCHIEQNAMNKDRSIRWKLSHRWNARKTKYGTSALVLMPDLAQAADDADSYSPLGDSAQALSVLHRGNLE